MDPRIADYIRENRRRYTREAVTRQLVEAGHDPGEVQRTWAALDSRDADDVAGEGFWGRFALILVGINVGVFLLVGLLTGMLQSFAGGGVVLLVILGVALVIGALVAWGLVAATGPTKLSPTIALVIGAAIPALFALLIGGACYALVGAIGGMGSPPMPPRTGHLDVTLRPPLELSQTTDAICHPYGEDPAMGFSMTGSVEAPGGWAEIYVDASGSAASTEPVILISWFMNAGEGGFVWGSDMGAGRPGIEVGLDGFNGHVMFTDLPAGQSDPDSDIGDPLSGEITWTCE